MATTDHNLHHDYFDRASSWMPDMDKHYKRLEAIGATIETPNNHTLYTAGDLPDSCYLIKEGRVISYEYTYTGRQHVFSNNEPGSLILLPSIILGHRVTLSFVTALPSKLIRIQRNSLLNALSSDLEFASCIAYILAAKFVEVNERFRAGSGGRAVSWKLCNLLLFLADKHGEDYDGKTLIKLKYSQQMMADYLHVNRTTIARTVKELTSSGLIERVNDYYCIRSMDRIKTYMDDIDMYADR